MATHFSTLAWKIPRTVLGVAKSWTRLSDFTFTEIFGKDSIDYFKITFVKLLYEVYFGL